MNCDLYHYTSIHSLNAILESNTLKASCINRLNDALEAFINGDEIPNCITKTLIQEYIRTKCRVISCVEDRDGIRGMHHPRMWAQYANNATGVCLAFDKEKLLRSIEEQNSFCDSRPVEYVQKFELRNFNSNESKEAFVSKNYKDVFFKKLIDWRDECEYRIFTLNDKEYFDFGDSLKAIYLGPKFKDTFIPGKDNEEIVEHFAGHKDMYHLIIPTYHGYVDNQKAGQLLMQKLIG